MPEVICVLGVERSGSSRVISLLTGFEGLFVREEIFNPWRAVSLDAEVGPLGQLAGIPDAADVHDSRLVEWIHDNPMQVIDWLRARAQGKAVVFKLFPGHLPVDLYQAVLARSDVGFLLLRRRPIDVYISVLKTRVVRSVRYVDTTNVQVVGKLGDYLALEARMRVARDEALAILKRTGRPYADLSYANEIACEDSVLRDALDQRLRGMGLDPGPFVGVSGPQLVRQDKGDSYSAKMSNWTEFAEEMKGRGIYLQAFQE